jgi:hypothetical protein
MSPEQRSSIIKAISTGKTESLANAIDEAKSSVRVFTSYDQLVNEVYDWFIKTGNAITKGEEFYYELEFTPEDMARYESHESFINQFADTYIERNNHPQFKT